MFARLLLLVSLAAPLLSQHPVFRVTVNLVQVDAVVTDSKGRQVTDLTADDFQILEDGRVRTLTSFSFVQTRSAPTIPGHDPLAPVALRREQVRRTIALVVDDLSMSFESVNPLRVALRKYVDEQMAAGDLVAIVRTSAGMGSLQRFTADRRVLHAAIDRLRYLPGAAQEFALLDDRHTRPERSGDSSDKESRKREELARQAAAATTEAMSDIEELRRARLTVGSLGAVRYVVGGLRDMPGRKAVVLFSDGISLGSRHRISVLEMLRRLIDLANRSSVLIYTMDARGLQAPGLGAEAGGIPAASIEESLRKQMRETMDSLEGMVYLAQQTGGFTVHNTNNYNRGIDRVIEDLSGYYLLGYTPDESTFQAGKRGPEYRKITVKVKDHPDLRVRFRSGFYGVTDEAASPAAAGPIQQLAAALNSPFGASAVRTKLTCLYLNLPKIGGVLRNMVHIDARDIHFSAEPDETQRAVVDIAAVAHGEEGVAVTRQVATWELRLSTPEFQRALQDGVLYSLDVPVKREGAYHMRIAVRDAGSGKVGAASQFVEAPRFGKGPPALSGILLSRGSLIDDPESLKRAANRVFRAGDTFYFLFQVYNARRRRGVPMELGARFSLLRDGERVYTGNPKPVSAENQEDPDRLIVSGRFRLEPSLKPGPYVLHVALNAPSPEGNGPLASQWIDFEIVR